MVKMGTLILTIKAGTGVQIGDNVRIDLAQKDKSHFQQREVRLRIVAPKDIKIRRFNEDDDELVKK